MTPVDSEWTSARSPSGPPAPSVSSQNVAPSGSHTGSHTGPATATGFAGRSGATCHSAPLSESSVTVCTYKIDAPGAQSGPHANVSLAVRYVSSAAFVSASTVARRELVSRSPNSSA